MKTLTTIENSVSEQVKTFYESLDSFDEENSLMKYDRALIQDAYSAIRRVERIRAMRDAHEKVAN